MSAGSHFACLVCLNHLNLCEKGQAYSKDKRETTASFELVSKRRVGSGPRPPPTSYCAVCAVSLQPGRARPAWAGPAAAPPRGPFCSSRSTDGFQLTAASFSEILFGFKVTEDCSPWGLPRCSKFASQR